ncbi:unnamed protein product [Onchocerca ochengi]|uniref:Uncharacterized protein n=1 Tax=Onchocerca ochengi TaxID=42157 RepID=A0A182ELA5_ONCOC|nr:unnamed protein product [Onchocerca ochengi]
MDRRRAENEALSPPSQQLGRTLIRRERCSSRFSSGSNPDTPLFAIHSPLTFMAQTSPLSKNSSVLSTPTSISDCERYYSNTDFGSMAVSTKPLKLAPPPLSKKHVEVGKDTKAAIIDENLA